MSDPACVVCVSEGKVPDLAAALRAAMRYPLVEQHPADITTKLAATAPAAIVVPVERPAPELMASILRYLEDMESAYLPILAAAPEDWGGSTIVLPLPTDAVPSRTVARLTAALRVRALHATVLRRAAAQERTNAVPSPINGESLNEATVLVAGRGGGYPALTLAVGERVGLIGALSFETARQYLEGRDIDGIVIGDGFPGRAVEDFLDLLRTDARFRDLPIVVADSRIGGVDFDDLPNADRIRGGAERVLAHLLPLVHLHAFATRLKRCARSLESRGFVDAETGLLTCDAFIRDLTRAVEDSKKHKSRLSLARFSFERIAPHASIDAARIVSRLVRAADFACQDDDGSIHVAFTDTDLKAAHVVARRIASVLKHTMLSSDPDGRRLNPQVALVTRKPADTAESLVARVGPHPVAAE
jgi:GGDEF domain-containing protein